MISRAKVYPCLRLLIIVNIDDSLGPLACWNLAVEQDVDLAVRSVLHLRQEEVCENEAEETSATPDVTALATEVCFLRYC
jgi:hypothetical protein